MPFSATEEDELDILEKNRGLVEEDYNSSVSILKPKLYEDSKLKIQKQKPTNTRTSSMNPVYMGIRFNLGFDSFDEVEEKNECLID